ncbi:hypothetical protein QE152_g425 [Popillia japonica]|uniref:Uncharacterized protein n=1 Tax=Popillia japonica TaxID=7064 RepID=A0AAW1NIJ3_POPJA
MLCLCWRVLNWPLLFLPLHALLLISECVCGENYLGLLPNAINLLQTNKEFKLSRVDNKVGPPIHPHVRLPDGLPTLYDESISQPAVVRVKRGNSECQDGGEKWIPPGQRKQDRLPPGLQRKGPCRNRMPPGQKKKKTPNLNGGEFIFPVEDGGSPAQDDQHNVVVYVNNRSVILLNKIYIK